MRAHEAPLLRYYANSIAHSGRDPGVHSAVPSRRCCRREAAPLRWAVIERPFRGGDHAIPTLAVALSLLAAAGRGTAPPAP